MEFSVLRVQASLAPHPATQVLLCQNTEARPPASSLREMHLAGRKVTVNHESTGAGRQKTQNEGQTKGEADSVLHGVRP